MAACYFGLSRFVSRDRIRLTLNYKNNRREIFNLFGAGFVQAKLCAKSLCCAAFSLLSGSMVGAGESLHCL